MNNCNYSKPPTENNELWKDVVGYEGYYKVSNKGRIWSVARLNRGRFSGNYFLTNNIDHRNRYTVTLNKNGNSTF